MILTSGNYYTPEANREYWSVSLFKAFDKCEAAGLAQVRGQYEREETDALLIGSYVDAYFTGELDEFVGRHADVMFKKNGELYAKYEALKLKLFEIFRVVDGKEEVLAIGLDEESTQRVVEIINKEETPDE